MFHDKFATCFMAAQNKQMFLLELGVIFTITSSAHTAMRSSVPLPSRDQRIAT